MVQSTVVDIPRLTLTLGSSLWRCFLLWQKWDFGQDILASSHLLYRVRSTSSFVRHLNASVFPVADMTRSGAVVLMAIECVVVVTYERIVDGAASQWRFCTPEGLILISFVCCLPVRRLFDTVMACNLVTTISDSKDICMNCPDVTLRCIKCHLCHVVSLSTCNVFYVRFYRAAWNADAV